MTNEKTKVKNERSAAELFREFIDDLQRENTYRFSSPWRPKGSLSIVVPIIQTGDPKSRKYITLQETENLTITDSGSIGGVKVTNKGEAPIFLKIGSILRGIGTQSRAVNKSMFIEAGKTVDVTVNCVHASHGIRRGSSFSSEPDLTSPAFVEAALLRSEQREVWARVSHYSRLRSRMGGSARDRADLIGSSDNLVRELGLGDTFAKIIEEITKEVPTHEGQVGIVVLDENGVYGLEMFDSPESWKALSKGMMNKFGEIIVRKVDEKIIDVRVNAEKVKEGIIKFLSMVRESRHSSNIENNATVIRIHDKSSYGELVFYKGEFVHLTAIRNDDERLKTGSVGVPADIARAMLRR